MICRKIEVMDDVFCLFYGLLENTKNLRYYLKVSDSATDPQMVIELYKMWKAESAHIVDSPLSEVEGSFSFILYDRACDYVAICVVSESLTLIEFNVILKFLIQFFEYFCMSADRMRMGVCLCTGVLTYLDILSLQTFY